jgi:hypothetical protein
MQANECPHANDCAHKPKLRLDEQGCCVDCGTPIQPVHSFVPRPRRQYERYPAYDRVTEPDLYDTLVKRSRPSQ